MSDKLREALEKAVRQLCGRIGGCLGDGCGCTTGTLDTRPSSEIRRRAAWETLRIALAGVTDERAGEFATGGLESGESVEPGTHGGASTDHEARPPNPEPTEEWRTIPGYDGHYEISSLGRVRALKCRSRTRSIPLSKPRILRTRLHGAHGSRYLYLGLRDGKGQQGRPVHLLVLTAFHGERPQGHEAAHLNGDATDNRATNLAWVTPKENQAHRRIHGTSKGSRNPKARLSEDQIREIRRLAKGALSHREIAGQFGVSAAHISKIVRKLAWSHV